MAMAWILIIDTTKTYSWTARPVGFPTSFQNAPEEHGNAGDWKELPSRPFAGHRWNGAYLSAPRWS
jgi:hypothetical protein